MTIFDDEFSTDWQSPPLAVLGVAEMAAADAMTIKIGTKGAKLMEAAGRAVANEIIANWKKSPVIILSGPGNNGGDGFVVARILKQKGWKVKIYLLGDSKELTGDAKNMAQRWTKTAGGKIKQIDLAATEEILKNISANYTIIVDAIFGAGLNRPLDGVVKKLIDNLSRARDETEFGVVAIDMPSGVSGDSGNIIGQSVLPADLTVTFCRFKPGHLLLPGSAICGDLCLADIGITDQTVKSTGTETFINSPILWLDKLNWPDVFSNKYSRGHVLVLGGEQMTGAARLVSMGARRAGAGLVSIACSENVFAIYATACEAGIIISPFHGLEGFEKIISDKRINAIVIGPGNGNCVAAAKTQDIILLAISTGRSVVVDADGINAFSQNPEKLFKAIKAANKKNGNKPNVIITPHGGEFARLFPDLANTNAGKLEMTKKAAKDSGAVVVFKGADTVIAAPDGRAIIDSGIYGESSWLASAGSGDVLAGMIGAIIAGGADSAMDIMLGASAAVWMHTRAAAVFGPGLVAEDIAKTLPEVWGELAHYPG